MGVKIGQESGVISELYFTNLMDEAGLDYKFVDDCSTNKLRLNKIKRLENNIR